MNNDSNLYVAYTMVLCGIVGLAGFLVGYDRGERFGERTVTITEYETVELPPHYASACAEMMEAAWEVQDAVPAGLPHNP